MYFLIIVSDELVWSILSVDPSLATDVITLSIFLNKPFSNCWLSLTLTTPADADPEGWPNTLEALLVIVTVSEFNKLLFPELAVVSLSVLIRLIVLNVPSSLRVFSTVTIVPAAVSLSAIVSPLLWLNFLTVLSTYPPAPESLTSVLSVTVATSVLAVIVLFIFLYKLLGNCSDSWIKIVPSLWSAGVPNGEESLLVISTASPLIALVDPPAAPCPVNTLVVLTVSKVPSGLGVASIVMIVPSGGVPTAAILLVFLLINWVWVYSWKSLLAEASKLSRNLIVNEISISPFSLFGLCS